MFEQNEAAWRTETGLIDNYDFTIERSYFATDVRYQGGKAWLLHWQGKARTEDGETVDHTVIMGLGAGWASEDQGKTVNHEKGKEAFNRSSRYGRIVERAGNRSDPGYLGDECRQAIISRGTPRQASIWEGLSFHMKREEIDFKGEIGVKEWELPVKFLGVAGANPVTSAATPAANPAPAPVTNGSGSGGNKVLLARLRKLATEVDSHDEFVDKALELPGVGSDEELMAMVGDESSIYGPARA